MQFQPNETETRNSKPSHAGRSLVLIALGLCLGVTGDRLLSPPRRISDVSQSSKPAPSAAFSRIGNRIVVPAASPLRSRLVLANAVSKEVSHRLVLPAVVEADPARTVKVLPPLAGRVISLKVQLGERVTQGQELAVIDSGDLAQAYSDDRRRALCLGSPSRFSTGNSPSRKAVAPPSRTASRHRATTPRLSLNSIEPKRGCGRSAYRPINWKEPACSP